MNELPTLPAFIAEHLPRPRPTALAERRDGRTSSLSSADVHRARRRGRAARCARAASGAATGSRSWPNNRVDWLIADFGILYAGGVVVPMFATTADDQLAFILADSEAKLRVRRRRRGARRACARRCRRAADRRSRRCGRRRVRGVRRAARRRPATKTPRLAAYRDGIALDDLAVLIYTSGTTGQPKGVMLSHRNLVSDVTAAFDPQSSGLREGQIGLSVLPFAHIYEHTDALGYLYNGLVHYVTTPERLLEDLRAIRPHYVAFVPRIFERLIAGIIGNARAAGGARRRLVPWATRRRHRVRARRARRQADAWLLRAAARARAQARAEQDSGRRSDSTGWCTS